MKLTYWMAACLDDARCYNIRAKTKSAAAQLKQEQGAERYGPIEKVTVEYADGFELMFESLCEDGGYWEVAR